MGGNGEIYIHPSVMAHANRLRNIVAHELGHVVGFDQAPCGNSIMSEGAPTDTLTCNDVGSNVRYRLNESPIVVDTVGDGLALSSASGGSGSTLPRTAAGIVQRGRWLVTTVFYARQERERTRRQWRRVIR